MNLIRVEADPSVPFLTQLTEEVGPITIIGRYQVEADHREEFVAAWSEVSRHMLRHGCHEVQAYQGVGGSLTILEVASWPSTAHLRAAMAADGFDRLVGQLPPCSSSPQILEPLAVPGVCDGLPLHTSAAAPE